jgi:hypothetical protein
VGGFGAKSLASSGSEAPPFDAENSRVLPWGIWASGAHIGRPLVATRERERSRTWREFLKFCFVPRRFLPFERGRGLGRRAAPLARARFSKPHGRAAGTAGLGSRASHAVPFQGLPLRGRDSARDSAEAATRSGFSGTHGVRTHRGSCPRARKDTRSASFCALTLRRGRGREPNRALKLARRRGRVNLHRIGRAA